ncbi:ABC transporter ATP-binding protein [Tessaracoccus terricola]
MRVELRDVTKGSSFAATSLAFESGTARLAAAETEQRPTVLGLLASGRMAPEHGSILVDGEVDDARTRIRRRVALVDAPAVCDPAPDVATWAVVAEELMFAGRLSNRVAARAFLKGLGMSGLRNRSIADVGPRDRVRLLLELAALRKGVEGIVLVSPDRHGGTPFEWWDIAAEFGERGLAVLVIAGGASASVLEGVAPRAEAGGDDGTPPTARPRRARSDEEALTR